MGQRALRNGQKNIEKIMVRKFKDLNESEVALRALIYAVESKDIPNPNHPFPMGEAYLSHQLNEVKAVAEKLGIPLVPLREKI